MVHGMPVFSDEFIFEREKSYRCEECWKEAKNCGAWHNIVERKSEFMTSVSADPSVWVGRAGTSPPLLWVPSLADSLVLSWFFLWLKLPQTSPWTNKTERAWDWRLKAVRPSQRHCDSFGLQNPRSVFVVSDKCIRGWMIFGTFRFVLL